MMNHDVLGALLSGKGEKSEAMSQAYAEVMAEKKAKRKEDAKKMLSELCDLHESQVANRKKFKEADDKLTKQLASLTKRILDYENNRQEPEEKTEEKPEAPQA